jgi:hypothetical protein
MKIIKWVVSLFNKYFRKPKSEPVVYQEFRTDPIVFIKGNPETSVTVEQEESQPEDITSIKVEEVVQTLESIVEDVTGSVVVELKETLESVIEEVVNPIEDLPEVIENKEVKQVSDVVENVDTTPKETKKKSTRRSKSKKKS